MAQSPAETLRSRLAQYAYADAASPTRRSPRVAQRLGEGSGMSTAAASGVSTACASTSGYASDVDSDSDYEDEIRPRTNRKLDLKPDTKASPKRRADGSLDKFGWKKSRGYAAPETYAHLRHLDDCLEVGLNLVFCGINPGKRSAKRGHHFAHPTNKFWHALYQSGLTPRLLTPEEDSTLPSLYSMGLTNLVPRPTAEQNELSPSEMRVAVLPFTRKIIAMRPRVVCFVGKKIWDIFEGVAGSESRRRKREDEREEKEEAARVRKMEEKREKEREKVRSDVARQEAKHGQPRAGEVVAFTLKDGHVVKIEPGDDELAPMEVDTGQGDKPVAVTPAKRPAPATAELRTPPKPLSTPTSPYFRAIPHSTFPFHLPQPLRLVLPPLSAPPASDNLQSMPPSPQEAMDEDTSPQAALKEHDMHSSSSLPISSSSSAFPSQPPSASLSAPASPRLRNIDPTPEPILAPSTPLGVGKTEGTQSKLEQKGGDHTHTYFWVVPNTSGLERTPLAKQAELFARLCTFVASLDNGEPEGEFVDITLQDVEVAVAALPSTSRKNTTPKTGPPGDPGTRKSQRTPKNEP